MQKSALFLQFFCKFFANLLYHLIDEEIRGLFKQLSLQWSTIVLMRITTMRQELIQSDKLMMKLFSLLTVQVESFVPSYFETMKFPFSLDEPIWDRQAHPNLLFMGLENEDVNALRIFVSRPEFKSALSNGLENMSRSERMHLIMRPCKHHKYFTRGSQMTLSPRSAVILAPNDFMGYIMRGFFFADEPEKCYAVPAIIPRASVGQRSYRAICVPCSAQREVSTLEVNPMNNTWVFDTAFELLLLLKSFVFIASSEKERMTAKKILLDCFIVQSPFVYTYLPQFADLMQVQIPVNPFDSDDEYAKRLALAGSLVRARTDFVAERFLILYMHDQHVLTSESSRTLARFFPEFFAQDVPEPTSNKILIPDAVIDPGAIKTRLPGHVLMLRQFAKRYKSLVGFPFWEILPFWFRVSGAFRGSSQMNQADYIDPTMTKTSPTTLHVSNPSKLKIDVRLTPIQKVGRETIVLMSNTADFDDPVFVTAAQLGAHSFSVTEADAFFSIIGDARDTWETVIPTMRVTTKKPKSAKSGNSSSFSEVEVSSIKQHFIDDMRQFAVEWAPCDTEELINILPRVALREPTFASVENIAKGSSLCSKFSQTVVVLRALLIHQFNYIRYTAYRKVPVTLWISMTAFVSAEDAADTISAAIQVGPDNFFPVFSIDRHAAHRIIVDGKGDPDKSIIHQLARVFSVQDPRILCCRKRPWKVAFVGESAIDAGGPARELLTEAAASIFEPTSQLAIPVPNMRNHHGANKDVYVPFDRNFNRRADYVAIGTLIGIIIRTGLSQDLPFAPLVWRFLANEMLTADDITCLDEGLADHFRHMREAAARDEGNEGNERNEEDNNEDNNEGNDDNEKEDDFAKKYAFPWSCENWDGQRVALPGHREDAFVERDSVEQYIKEVVDMRINAIIGPLRDIRQGFRVNTGFKHNSMMSGALLSRMAQGNGIITVQHLKQITVVYDFEDGLNNPYVKRFFRAVEKLTAEQRKLLLKFITTLTRLPNSTINPDFKLKIDMLQTDAPDEKLPTSSTCFNKLHLPKYSNDEVCYQKLLIAIQYCQTMENQ